MAWFKLDDQGAFHSKVLAAGNEAYGAWCRAGQWSSAHLTEGKIPRATALSIAPMRVWKKLVDARGTSQCGLVEPDGDDFLLHDYLVYNPTADEALAKRRARSEAGQLGGKRSAAKRQANAQANNEANAQAIASANSKQTPTPSPSPSPSPSLDPQITLSGDLPPKQKEAKPRQAKKQLTAWPDGFAVSPAIEAMCRAERLPNPHEVLPHFRDKALAKNYRYAEWESAFRNWMRSPITRQNYEPWGADDDEVGRVYGPPGEPPPGFADRMRVLAEPTLPLLREAAAADVGADVRWVPKKQATP